jgi:hypothetical protein
VALSWRSGDRLSARSERPQCSRRALTQGHPPASSTLARRGGSRGSRLGVAPPLPFRHRGWAGICGYEDHAGVAHWHRRYSQRRTAPPQLFSRCDEAIRILEFAKHVWMDANVLKSPRLNVEVKGQVRRRDGGSACDNAGSGKAVHYAARDVEWNSLGVAVEVDGKNELFFW